MGFRVLHKRKLLIAAFLTLLSCSREKVFPEGSFRLDIASFDGETKSLLGGSQIESKVTGVTLAAYSRGRLYRCTYSAGNGSSIPFRLENEEEYNVYALVNTGDSRSRFPEYESDIPGLEYNLTSYNSGTSSVLSMGIPMAGRAQVTGGGTPPAIQVKRLLARVTAHVECGWPDASVQYGVIGNMNGRLLPFGESAMEGPGDAFSFLPEKHVASGGSSADLVFYVPENLQGSVGGISAPEEKSHERNASVDAMKDRLTYLEVLVSGTGLYNGEIRYRSYLGANSANNFDIVRNSSYNWTLTYGEDGLSDDNWKKDNDLEDLRELQTAGPLYVIPGESVSLKDYVTTNMPLGRIGWSMSWNEMGADLLADVHNAENLQGVSFTVDDSHDADDYGNRVVNIVPLANPRLGLGGNVNVYVVDEQIAWRNTTAGKYFVTPGRHVDGDADFYVTYLDDDLRDRVTVHMKGKGGDRWNCTGGINPTLLGDTGKDYDQVRFSPLPTTLPGDYPINAMTSDGSSASATVHVNDTRSIMWTDRSTAVPSGNGFIGYRYLSENKVVVILASGERYTTAGGLSFTAANTPFTFVAGDRSAKVSDLSASYKGVPLEGALLLGNNYQNRIGITMDSPLSIGAVSTRYYGGSYYSGNLMLIPSVGANLSNASSYTIYIQAKNGYDNATRHTAEARIRVGSGTFYELALTPAISKVTVGATVTLTARFYTFTVSEDELRDNYYVTLSPSNSSLTWTGATRGVFTATEPGNFRITASYYNRGQYHTAYADIEVTSSDVDVNSGWDGSEHIVLD